MRSFCRKSLLLLAVGAFIAMPWAWGDRVVPSHPAAAASGDMEFVFLDLPYGYATLIQSPEGGWTLFDAGTAGDRNQLFAALRDRNIKRLDFFALTSFQPERIGGAPTIVRNFDIRFFAAHPSKCESKELDQVMKVLVPRFRDGRANSEVLTAGQVSYPSYNPMIKMELLGPSAAILRKFPKSPSNSVISHYRGEAKSILLGFGATGSQQLELAQQAKDDSLRADLLQVPVGRNGVDLNQAFLRKVAPKIAVIPVPRRSKVRPSAALLRNLRKRGIRVLRTDQRGTISVKTDGLSLKVKTAR